MPHIIGYVGRVGSTGMADGQWPFTTRDRAEAQGATDIRPYYGCRNRRVADGLYLRTTTSLVEPYETWVPLAEASVWYGVFTHPDCEVEWITDPNDPACLPGRQ